MPGRAKCCGNRHTMWPRSVEAPALPQSPEDNGSGELAGFSSRIRPTVELPM